MAGLGLLIFLLFALCFGPPIIFFIVGVRKQRANNESAKVYYILGTLWLVIGGGSCASLMLSA